MDAASLHTFDAGDVDHSELVEGRIYFAMKRTDDYILLSDHVDDEGFRGGGGGLTEAQATALIQTWARASSTADIPEDRLPDAIARTADIPMEVVDITDDGLPDADGTQTDKIFLDRVRKTASFLTEDQIAQTDAAGNFTEYPESTSGPYLGAFANDQAAVTHVTNNDDDLNKFYWDFNQHSFRYWHKTEVTPGTFDYHFSTVTSPATWLAARESFDHSGLRHRSGLAWGRRDGRHPEKPHSLRHRRRQQGLWRPDGVHDKGRQD